MRRTRSGGRLTFTWCLLCAIPASAALGQEQKPDSAAAPAAVKLPPEQLEALVAPIALYPDPLLAQTLVASTYPLEVIQLHQWLAKHPDLKDKALVDSVAKQPWDPAIQSMAAVPEVVKRLSDDIQWATELGNAFLAQQGEVMDAVQRLRKKAKDKGALESNEQQKVETKVVEQKTVIVVEQTNPEIVYVPTYNPTYVYGPPPYPYPPVYYPPYTPGAAFVSFGFGMMMGAAMWGGSCCYAGWGGGNTVIINNNNNFNQINNINRGGAGNNNWNHNASHRGGAPYGDRATANKYGGSSAGASNRAAGGATASNRAAGGAGQGGASASNRAAGGAGQGGASASNRAAGGAGVSDRSASGAGSRGGSSAAKPNAMSGGSKGFSGSSARASSSRGSSSMGSRGGSRGGGGGRRR